MEANRKIAWEKFTPQHELPNHLLQQNNTFVDNNPPEREDEEEENEAHENANEIINFLHFQDLIESNKIKTPFGTYSAEDEFSPYNMFECWIGHTNFKISKDDYDVLNTKINGIGCLKVLSPYRFFIGIEKMFTFPAVRIQIQKDLCNNMEIENDFESTNDVDYTINLLISKINDALFSIKESEKWAVFVGQDGTVQSIKNSEFASDSDYREKLMQLKSLKNGNIITYDSL